ncbi:MAG: cysteine--tRNA ligase, partial [Acidimicrobiales bacterium]
MLRLHDTAFATVRELSPRTPGEVSMYVCGPTVYGPPHAGHGRMALVWDVLRRYLEWRGQRVRFVSNITDIDDKIINRAAEEGRSAGEVAAEYEALWYRTMDALGVRRPDEDPHATAYVPQMVELISRLVDDGLAYETADGVYFSAACVADYGLLAHQALADMRSGERVAMVDDKRAPADFSLWKKAKPGEPTWPSPWGPGRPGWHTECVVMSLGLLGEDFDVHGGGVDLVFPHHENERAQAVAAGHRFARHWVHSGHLTAGGGEKMSKSLGNVLSLPELLASVDPRAYRLVVLQSHYRSPMEVSPAGLRAAEVALARIDGLARSLAARGYGVGGGAEADAEVLDRFSRLMDDDLATPAAMGVVFDAISRANSALDRGDDATAAALGAAVLAMAAALGFEPAAADAALPSEVAALVAERDG